MSFFATWRSHPLTMITAVLGVIYGVGFAFGADDKFSWWMGGGGAVVGTCFILSLLLAHFSSRKDVTAG